ncbi:OLC1v1033585C1 [Oldenlandia corymbosa var. corymbosa]|uniref:OLC1v1033585C1 n=1 Tax=Oldenlandia corymbosa var. corymbosa TaxID=529605 RepID=A0AAV1CRS9_OLDCO|nr:OLC1v1033585C1 [Oldenlandia corymbosa var. corymbosa]
MGACCSCQRVERFDGFYADNDHQVVPHKDNYAQHQANDDDDLMVRRGENGARVRLQGSSRFVSTYIQQGKKGTNQDALTVWENFLGEKDSFFCGVFDGHGPSGHNVARYVRDLLPSKLSSSGKVVVPNSTSTTRVVDAGDDNDDNHDNGTEAKLSQNPFESSWKPRILKSFLEMDEELEGETTVESYCSGTTAVTVLKQKEHLMVANLGDSRAVLCTRDDQDELVAEQLTVDLKPNLPGEAERIRSCQGRVMAMEGESNVYRVWMPDEDTPGLAMARAFGDFCLKDFGVISTPEVTYRKITDKDEFVVLATDGVWDVLSNHDVVRIVASARKRATAARLLVDIAARVWRYKYPRAKMDDCAVVCLFLKRPRPLLTKSLSEVTELSLNYSALGPENIAPSAKSDDGLDTVLNLEVNKDKDMPANDQIPPAPNNDEVLIDDPDSARRGGARIRSRRQNTRNVETIEE